MQEVGGSSPPISTDWVWLSVFSACGNLWLLHAFFLFRLFLGPFWFLFFGMHRWGTAVLLLPIVTVVLSGFLLGRWNFFCGRQRRYASVFQMWRGLRFGAFDARGLGDAGCILWNARRALRVLLNRE